jgi:hypothetical protein
MAEVNPTNDQEIRKREWAWDILRGVPTVESFLLNGAIWKQQIHTFDDAGNYTQLDDSAGGCHQWPIDDNGLPKEIVVGLLGAPLTPVLEIKYTPGLLVDRLIHKNAVGQPFAETEFIYDGLGRQIRKPTHKIGSRPALIAADTFFPQPSSVSPNNVRRSL